jgi:hypothetical protein
MPFQIVRSRRPRLPDQFERVPPGFRLPSAPLPERLRSFEWVRGRVRAYASPGRPRR